MDSFLKCSRLEQHPLYPTECCHQVENGATISVSGSADIALAPLSVTAERENDVDFTVPYYDLVGTTILMKKADTEYSLFKFMEVRC